MQPNKKNTLRAYFTFSVRERRAVFLLLLFTAIFFLLPRFFPYFFKQKSLNIYDSIQQSFKDSASQTDTIAYHYAPKKNEKYSEDYPESYFYFDPNKATLQEWKQLGVREKTARTIMRYLQRGGCFRKPEDLKKIWGLSPRLAERLIPFVLIEGHIANSVSIHHQRDSAVRKSFASKNQLDINQATQAQWEQFRGIGAGLASRIIKFRGQLGGFISIDQVKETYGLPDSTFQSIRGQLTCKEISVNRLNLNQAEFEQLSRHPYIRYKAARAIITYREQHGLFQSVNDVEKIESISPDIFHRMEKYITVE